MAKSTVPPVVIDVKTGAGCPGGWFGLDYRKGAQQAADEVKDVLNKINFADDNQARVDIQRLSRAEGDTAAKSAGCGGRRAEATYIYSGSVKPDPAASASWAKKKTILAEAGYRERDTLKPPTVTDNDWRAAVENYSNYAVALDTVNAGSNSQ